MQRAEGSAGDRTRRRACQGEPRGREGTERPPKASEPATRAVQNSRRDGAVQTPQKATSKTTGGRPTRERSDREPGDPSNEGGKDPPKRSEERKGTPEALVIHYTRRADGAREARARRRG